MSGGPSYRDEYDDFMGRPRSERWGPNAKNPDQLTHGTIDGYAGGETNAESLNALMKNPEFVAMLLDDNPELFKLIREKHPRLMELVAKRQNLINAGGADIPYEDMQTNRMYSLEDLKDDFDAFTSFLPAFGSAGL